MFKVKSWFKTDVILLSVAFVALLVTVTPMVAQAQFEANRPPLAMAGGATATLEISADSARELPKGYTFYSGDGASFWIQAFASETTLESVPVKVPDGQPITISAPAPIRVNGVSYHRIIVNATAVSDSVYILPLDK